MPENQHPLARAVVSLITTHDEENSRAARRLHDDVAQILTAVGLRLGLLRMDHTESELAAQLDESQKLIEKAIHSVRSLSVDLDPAIVDRMGLAAALERLIESQRRSFPGSIQLSYDPSVKLPAVLARTIFRIVERALENATRHSAGRLVLVGVTKTAAGIRAQVSDDGRGFDPDQQRRNPPGIGLLLMYYYAEQNGMQLTISTGLDQGTIVTAECSV